MSLTIPRGQTVAPLGPNGAGESTAANLLLGPLRPTGGEVHVLGMRPDAAIVAGRVGRPIHR